MRTTAFCLILLLAGCAAPAAPAPPAATPTAPPTPTAGASATRVPSRPTPTPRPAVDLQATAVAIGNATLAAAPRPTPTGITPVLAWRACMEAITAQLKAPATAIYPPLGSAEVTRLPQDGSLRLRSYVDAQNGFGALIRTAWACRVGLTPSGRPDVIYASLDAR